MIHAETIPVLLHDTPSLRGLAALGHPFLPRVAGGWDELRAAAPRLAPGSVLVVDAGARVADGRVPGGLWELMAAHPSVPVVVAVDAAACAPSLLARLLDRGAAEVLDLSLDRTPALAERRIREAVARPFKRRLEGALSRYASADARTLLRAATEAAVRGGGADELARTFGVSPATVGLWCAAAALPPPRTLQAWMRLLLAASLLEEQARGIADVARTCGYAGDRS
ncbi:MAG TPA: hypothetical protein VFQ45_17455, partial [Longimicrobium sp.]|nr:hypothetical protein [Longimicrobium sp.]